MKDVFGNVFVLKARHFITTMSHSSLPAASGRRDQNVIFLENEQCNANQGVIM